MPFKARHPIRSSPHRAPGEHTDQRDQQPQDYNAPGPQPYYVPQLPSAPPHPTVRRRTAIAIGIGALILGAGIGAAGHSNKTTDTTAANAPQVTATVTTAKT